MKNAGLMSFLGAVLPVCSLMSTAQVVHGQGCVLSEDCSDNLIGSKWDTAATNPSSYQCVEQNGRLEFPALTENLGGQLFAGVISNGWKINMLKDWMVSVEYYLDFNSPTYGDTGLGFVVAFDFDTAQPTQFTGYSLSGGIENYGFSDYPFEAVRFWQGGTSTLQSLAYRSYTQSTVYVWYDADSDCISHSDIPGLAAVTVCGLRNLSGLTTAHLGMIGYSFGLVPATPGSQSWGDNFCLMYGELVGESVGACCMGDGCIQTLVDECAGNWLGVGTTCDLNGTGCVVCESDLDSNGQVDGADLTIILSQWGCTSGACSADLNDDGLVDGADLTIILASWGACDL